MSTQPLHLFEGFGIELEYMIVRDPSLELAPLAPELLSAAAGEEGAEDVERGEVAWSNELVAHVVELKTNGPAPRLVGLDSAFQRNVEEIQTLLAGMGARLLPGGMHPWMVPTRDSKLFPGEYNEVYRTFDRIFDCKHHGWSNLQSTHINLPFANDDEFARLHAAIRVALPILPALAASTPVMDGGTTGFLDNRMRVYRGNARRVPQVAGAVVPEPVYSRAEYEGELLASIYRALEPHDPEGVLRHEWANSRGAIARFDRMAIEIRILDIQECPRADLAVATGVVELVRALVDERLCAHERQRGAATADLAALLWRVVDEGDQAVIDDAAYLEMLGLGGTPRCTAGELWGHLVEQLVPAREPARGTLDLLVERGPLARRLMHACGDAPTRGRLNEVWTELADCLSGGRLFLP
ncbi:MAG: glutamate--cysteine ligase [Planctomycetaceae bacterium]|nr:glutamate--cysteine ligase [Planctomycetaceae bacterium]